MADYSRYKTETLEKMREKAYDKYYELTLKPSGNWGDGMRLSKLPQHKAWERAKERLDAIDAELEKRKNIVIEEHNTEIMQEAYFGFDGDDYKHLFEGYHNPDVTWNGWALPSFTFETAKKVCEYVSRINNDYSYEYDEETDCFLIYNKYENTIEKSVGRSIYSENDFEYHVYSIGDGWCWDSFSIDEIERKNNNNDFDIEI